MRLAIWLLAGVLSAGGQTIEFIHLTDTHVTDLEGAAPRLAAARKHFSDSKTKLQAFFARQRPSFILITGDLVDAFQNTDARGRALYGQIEAFLRASAGSAPLYLALGNHDIQNYSMGEKLIADQSVAGEARAAWSVAAPAFRKGTWYSFERRVGATRYLFVVLDNGFTGAAMSGEQLGWLTRQLETHPGFTVVLAMHIPVRDDATARAIRSAVGPHKVALVLSGHTHKDVIDDIPLGASGAVQVQTSAFGYGENNWRLVRLHEDRIEVGATGKPGEVARTVPAAR